MKKALPTLVLLLAVTFASAQIDMLNGLQGHYRFNGDVKDETANHFNGTLHGLAHTNDDRLILNDNSHDYLSVPAAVMDGLGDFTISFHVAFENFHVSGDDPTNQVLSGYGPDIDGVGVAYNRPSQSWVFTVNGESVNYFFPNYNTFDKICLFLMRDGDSLKLYLDAVKVAAWQINTTPISIHSLVVGQRATCGNGCFNQKQCLSGRVENLAFWNRALTFDEIDLGCHAPIATFDYFDVNCTNGTVDFTNSSQHSDSYIWNFGDGNSSTDLNPEDIYAGGAGTYTVTLIAINHWGEMSDTISKDIVVTNTTVDPDISADGSTTICDGSSVLLHATPAGAASYQWSMNGSPISGATNESFTATEGGNYSVSVTGATGCSGLSGETAVSINEAPLADITPAGAVAICDGGTQMYMANTGDLTYQWSMDGTPINGATTMMYTATSAGTYAVTTWNTSGCSATSSSSQLTVNETPVASITPTGEISACAGSGQSFSANAGIGITYQWLHDGSTISGATGSTYSTSVGGGYSVIETNSNGCSGTSATTNLTVNANPDISITPDGSTTFCDGSSVILNATGNGSLTYEWKKDGNLISGATNATYTASQSGSYTVKVTDQNGCKNSATNVVVTVNENPVATIDPSSSVAFCEGASQIYTATSGGGLAYQWLMDGSEISGATNQTYSTNSSGTYSVIVTNGSNCSSTSSSSTLTVNANPAATITADGSTTFCDGGSVDLMGSTGIGYSYQWKKDGSSINGETNMNYTVTSDGNYSVKITDGNGCHATSDGLTITVNENPAATIDPDGEVKFCDGGSQIFNANTGLGLTYQWMMDGTDISGATNADYSASSAGSYSVTVTNDNGCSSVSSSSNVVLYENPAAVIDPSGDVSFCDGGSQMYSASSGIGFTYQWTWNGDDLAGETNSTYTANASGSYAVIIWNSNGCSSTSNSSNIDVHANPEATIDPSGEVAFCDGGNQTFNANSGLGLSYQWTMNGTAINGATGSSYSATSAGDYAVVVTNDLGCSSTSSSSSVAVNAIPEATVTANGDLSVCQGKNVELTANTGLGLTYQWQQDGSDIPGATSDNYLADAQASYNVVVTNASGCSALSDAIGIIINPLPEITLGMDSTVCDTSNYMIDAGAGFESYLWNDGSENQMIPVTGSGDYWVIVTDANGCGAADTVNITVEICSGIDEVLLANSINVYPNPTFGVFVIELNMPAVDQARIDLVNTLGQFVQPIYNGKVSGRMSIEVDGKNLSKGVYFVKMNIGDTVVTKKVVISSE